MGYELDLEGQDTSGEGAEGGCSIDAGIRVKTIHGT